MRKNGHQLRKYNQSVFTEERNAFKDDEEGAEKNVSIQFCPFEG